MLCYIYFLKNIEKRNPNVLIFYIVSIPKTSAFLKGKKMKKSVAFAVIASVSAMINNPVFTADKFVLDNFEAKTNALYTKSGIYESQQSKAQKARTQKEKSEGENSLLIAFKKQKEGFCGYYMELKQGNKYFDASSYSKITFMVKGNKGGENFQVGLADKKWFEKEDSVKADDIGSYLPQGKITTEWQKAEIPFTAWIKNDPELNITELGTIAICFETSCFPDGVGSGVIYIDEIAFE